MSDYSEALHMRLEQMDSPNQLSTTELILLEILEELRKQNQPLPVAEVVWLPEGEPEPTALAAPEPVKPRRGRPKREPKETNDPSDI